MRGLLLLLGTGCNAVFGLHEVLPQDATVYPDAVGCSGVRFQAPTPLDIPLPGDAGDGTLVDPLTFWLEQVDSSNHQHIYIATRTTPDGPFGLPVLAPSINTADPSEGDFDPALTADGLDIFFVSTRGGQSAVYEATRSSTADPFGPALTVLLGNVLPYNGLDVSWDGRTLYVTDSAGPTSDLHEVYRPTRDQPFGAPSGVIATGVTWPSVSPDGKELFFVPENGSGVRRLVRADPTLGNAFAVPMTPDVIDSIGSDPDITGDAHSLVVWEGPKFDVFPRSCP